MATNAATKDKCDYLGVELPSGWGNVLMAGAASMGSATLTGVGTDGKALSPAPAVEVDTASVSRRSLVVLVKPTVAADGTTTKNYLAEGATYTLTLANVPTPNAGTGQWG